MGKSKDLINTSAVRAYILARAEETRPGWKLTRVSDKAINQINAKLRLSLQGYVQRHPSRGQTFTEII